MSTQAEPEDDAEGTAGEAPSPEKYAWVRPFVVRVTVNALVLWAELVVFSLLRRPSRNAEGDVVLAEPLLAFSGGSLVAVDHGSECSLMVDRR